MAPKKSSSRQSKTSGPESENHTLSIVNRKKSHSTPLKTLNSNSKNLNSSQKEMKKPKKQMLASDLFNTDSDSDAITELPDIDMKTYSVTHHVKKETPIFSTSKRKSFDEIIDLCDGEAEDLHTTTIKKKKKKIFISSDEETDSKQADTSIITLSDTENKENQSGVVSIKRKLIYQKSESENDSDHNTKSYNFRSRRKTAKKIKYKEVNERQEAVSDDEVENISDDDINESLETRHRLRDLISDEDLNFETQIALRNEKERQKRLEERKQAESDAKLICDVEDIYLEANSENPILKIDSSITKMLKPHQIEGVKFMWESCYENVAMIERNSKGNGCLLAHCMGLGKTLQVIALIHTLLKNKEITRCHRVLILLPINVMRNWESEVEKWTKGCQFKIPIFEISSDTKALASEIKASQRLKKLKCWFEKGGILLMGYTMFSNLVHGKYLKTTKTRENFKEYLVKPGPDLIICDEGHTLKNDATDLAKACSQILTRRRIVLTGTPLQNNLPEYHCMVSFVKPNLLGTIQEFRNRFVNPIYNGQHRDSKENDVAFMKKRAYVLHRTLIGTVNRKDFSIIRSFIPPKYEYVLSIRMCNLQIQLYRTYLAKIRRIEDAGASNLGKVMPAILFNDFHQLSRIWTHPWLLKINERVIAKRKRAKADKNFIADDDEIEYEDDEENEAPSKKSSKKKGKKSIILDNHYYEDEIAQGRDTTWYEDLVTDDCYLNLNLSGKLILFEQILDMCIRMNDKLVVFSQSLPILDMIEEYLENRQIQSKRKVTWIKNDDYYRIDGSVNLTDRKTFVDLFNDSENERGRLFLVSTKAGGIGINLVGANRCIVFDSTWNPCYDTQSIYRLYRLGQKKEVFVYRFLSQGTMEEKIYMRQVTKNALSQRVIDEHTLERHFTSEELRELYCFYPDIYDGTNEPYDLPKDDILKQLLIKNKKWIVKYHEHDSLLENKADEKLTDAERRRAWTEFETETKAAYHPTESNSEQSSFQQDESANCVIS